jgi:beta-mannosidase
MECTYVTVGLADDIKSKIEAVWNYVSTMNLKQLVFAAGLALGPVQGAVNVLDVGKTADWEVSNSNGSITTKGNFPSQVHLDLMENGLIEDPYYGDNVYNYRWICYDDWKYSGKFHESIDQDENIKSHLVFKGLDTFANITFCGKHVGETENMFRQYIFDVSDIVKSCDEDMPSLEIEFAAATVVANEIANRPETQHWPEDTNVNMEMENVFYIRKEQNDFGWDWGGAFAPSGPWKPGYLVQTKDHELYETNALVDVYRKGQLSNIRPDQSQPWIVNVSLEVLGDLPEDAELHVGIDGLFDPVKLEGVQVEDQTITGALVLDCEPELWWPSQFGEQKLYNLTASVKQDGDALLDVHRQTGFRTIYLNMDEVTKEEQETQGTFPGTHWHFEINGHPFFAKGSNMIPFDSFWPRVTRERVEYLFESARIGNQVMLRVWSSGTYLPDFVYEIADQKGLLLWSEFQLSDGMYPTTDEFLDNLSEEAFYNVRRVNHHPSLALWSGGNELESLSLRHAMETVPQNASLYQAQFEKVQLETLLPIVWANTRSISFTPASTTNGYLSIDHKSSPHWVERYDNATKGEMYGNTELYNYDSTQSFNYSIYPIGRFNNEFGYHSMPSIHTWRQVLNESSLEFNSSMVHAHNRHYPPRQPERNYTLGLEGMGEMTMAVGNWLPTPNKDDKIENFAVWCYATQVFQAAFYRSQISVYRRSSGMPERTLGSLYWQLEDIWQGPTWAGIEYDGRWKVLHYGAKDIYEPVIIAPYVNVSESKDIDLYVTSDLWDEAKGQATYVWLDWSGEEVSSPSTVEFQIGSINSTKIAHIPEKDIPQDKENAVLTMEVEVTGTRPNSKEKETFKHTNYYHPVPLKDAKLKDPKIEVKYDSHSNEFVVSSEAVAPWTWLDLPDGVHGYFSDNAFLLTPGNEKRLSFSHDVGDWSSNVTVLSIYDLSTK